MTCNICLNKKIKYYNFGKFPKCYDFKKTNVKPRKYSFILKQCQKCSIIQLEKKGSDNTFIPKLPWIHNKEPSGHLKFLYKKIKKMVENNKKILFISEFDERIYSNFKNKKNISILSKIISNKKYQNQFEIIKKIQNKNLEKIKKKISDFDCVVCCRILEHAYDLRKLIEKIKPFLKSGGEFIFEIPDSNKPLNQGDIGMLWEEHPLYFTEKSFKSAMYNFGMKVINTKKFLYPQEDALIFTVKPYSFKKKLNLKFNYKQAENFFKKCLKIKKKNYRFIYYNYKKGLNTIFFGAGHRTVVYVNYLNIENFVSFIVDDDRNKKKLFFPGTNLRIYESKFLKNKKVDFCYLSVNINLEKKIIKKIRSINKNIKFFSTSTESKFFKR